MITILNTLGAGGLLTVFLFVGLGFGFAWALDWPARARIWIVGIAVASLPLSQLLPAGNPFREQITESLETIVIGIVIATPFAAYAIMIRRLRRRSEPPPPPPRLGLGLIEHDAALNAEMHAQLVALNKNLGGYDPIMFSVVHRDEAGEIEGAIRVIIALNRAEMRTLWVHPNARRTGVGGILIRAAEAEARTRGARTAVLETFSWQSAIGFYEAAGYDRAYTRTFPDGAEQYFYEKTL